MIKNFEEIEAWQMARELTKAVYAVVQSSSFSHDFELRDQIRRASVSIMANIAEGFEREALNIFKRLFWIKFRKCLNFLGLDSENV